MLEVTMSVDGLTLWQRGEALVRVLQLGALLRDDRDELLEGLASGALRPWTRPVAGGRFEVGLYAPGQPMTVLARVTRASVTPAAPEAN
jgi:hypothetical protein